MIHSNETQGDLMRPFEFLRFLLCNLRYKLNGLGKTHRKRIFVVELKLKPRSPFLKLFEKIQILNE